MTERTYINTETEIGRQELGHGITLVLLKHEYGYSDSPLHTYNGFNIEGLPERAIEQLGVLAKVMQELPEDGAFDSDYEELLEFFKEWASDTAEGEGLPFTFTDRDGDTNTYSPAALWESSGGCEWEQSAQYGYDYGWNI